MDKEAPVVEEDLDDLAQVKVTSHVKKFPNHVLEHHGGSYESCSGDEFALKTVLNVLGEVQITAQCRSGQDGNQLDL